MARWRILLNINLAQDRLFLYKAGIFEIKINGKYKYRI